MRRFSAPLRLALQSALLFPHPELPPVWVDELHTLDMIAKRALGFAALHDSPRILHPAVTTGMVVDNKPYLSSGARILDAHGDGLAWAWPARPTPVREARELFRRQ